MGMLHLAPALLLGIVVAWLLWPVAVEPSLRRLRTSRRPKSPPIDQLDEALFGAWSSHEITPGLADPLQRG